MAGKILANEEKAFKLLLELDTTRGPHSTGVLSVTPAKETTVCKVVGTPWDLYDSSCFGSLMRKTHTLLLGHNRFATVGKVNKTNAHPFEHGTVIGVHNGTLRNKHKLVDGNNFEVDSDALYYNIVKQGFKATLEQVDGAFALAWYEKNTHTISFVRNTERPLYYTVSEDGYTAFIASEQWMLSVALGKCGIKHGAIIDVPVGVYHSFSLSEKYPGAAEKLREVHTEKVDFFQPPPVVYTSYQGNNAGNFGTNSGGKPSVRLIAKDGKNVLSNLATFSSKSVDFEVLHMKQGDKRGGDYAVCQLLDNPDVELRIYTNSKGDLFKRLNESVNYWSAVVNGFNDGVDGSYLRVDHRTIVEVMEPEVTDYQGNKISVSSWVLLTDGGCGICGTFVTPRDAKDIEWVGRDCFVCKDCKETDFFKTLGFGG